MIKYNSLAAGLAALIALAPVSLALARELTVTGPPSLDTWSERVFYAIDNHLSYPVEPLNRMST